MHELIYLFEEVALQKSEETLNLRKYTGKLKSKERKKRPVANLAISSEDQALFNALKAERMELPKDQGGTVARGY